MTSPSRAPRTSLWLSRPRPANAGWPALIDSVDVEVAVVGGGIVGATTAMLLAAEGKRVALLEANTMSGGTTGHSTGKATVHTGSSFRELTRHLGVDEARLVVDGDRAALDVLRKWAEELGIPEAVHEVTSWAYAMTESGREELEAEQRAGAELGVISRWAQPDECPFGVAALGVDDQLLIEPSLIVDAFAVRAAEHGALVHEYSPVTGIDSAGDAITLTLANGSTVVAQEVVLATQVPILDRTMVFAACEYRRSHVVALEAPDAFERAPHMYTGIDTGGLSVRPARLSGSDDRAVFVVAGHGHPLDHDEDGTHIDGLVAEAQALTGGRELHQGWVTHDVFPADGRPFVGPVRADEHIYIATGFGGWGLARGVASAMSISAQILRGHARWEHPLDAQRLGAFVTPTAIKAGIRTLSTLVGDRLSADPVTAIEQLQTGTGTVVHAEGRSVAVARDGDGTIHAVSATCTH